MVFGLVCLILEFNVWVCRVRFFCWVYLVMFASFGSVVLVWWVRIAWLVFQIVQFGAKKVLHTTTNHHPPTTTTQTHRQQYPSCYWPDLDQTLNKGSLEHLQQNTTVTTTFVQGEISLKRIMKIWTYVQIIGRSCISEPYF